MAETEMKKFSRHLAALMRKNALLKQRSPCSFCWELFLAIGAVGLLVVARILASDMEALEVPAEHHVHNSMPVRLPECAEYISECSVELVEEKNHSLMCVKGVTFGCVAPEGGPGTEAAGVWASSGCYGHFHVGEGTHIHCKSGRFGKLHTCRAPNKRLRRLAEDNASEREDGSAGNANQLDSSDLLAGLLTGSGAQSSMRRLSARFGVASVDPQGGRLFQQWLASRGHPWASSVHMFESVEALQAHVDSKDYPERNLLTNRSTYLCGAVVFENSLRSLNVQYTLRFNRSLPYDPNLPPLASMMMSTKIQSESLIKNKQDPGPQRYDAKGITWYTQSGFLSMQRTVDTFLEQLQILGPAKLAGEEAANSGLSGIGLGSGGASWLGEDGRPHVVVPFPTSQWKRDIFATTMPPLLALFLLMSLAYSVNRMITSVVHEREARLRDGMRMMGMHPMAFYLSWILTYLAIYTFVGLGVVFCLYGGGILPHSSPSLLFVWIMLFAASSISYALVITAFFQQAKTAATVGSVIFYASSYLHNLAEVTSTTGFLRLISVFPPVCFELSANMFADMESQGIGITWWNIGLRSDSQRFSVLDGCCMLAFDAVFLLLLFLYLDMAMPRSTGLQLPWYFPLKPSFWRELFGGAAVAAAAKEDSSDTGAQGPEAPESSALVERDIGEAAAVMSRSGQVVKLQALSKSFGEIRAVQSLDLVMYQGEIFALLGHNGAGKTTTLGMLCGLMPPSRGSCEVFGHCLASEPAQVQKLLGVCPQHDVLWEELTCEEHLTLFAGFKGVPSVEVAAEVLSMLKRVGLHGAGAGKRQAGRLSGGMKRKLSLGIAFLGGSLLVVLDEPTSGLDPYSRRLVWELLRAMKHGRVTVLSTHYMDEADILGDRIAILHEGRLRCCGSPQFLKRAYDCGYNVTLVKQPGCEAEVVREALCRHVPELASEVVVLSDSANELMMQFPFAAARHFATVLGSLEQQLGELRVESYGVSITTLEEVFLKVASGESVERQAPASVDESGSRSPGHDSQYIELQDVPARQVRVHGAPAVSPSRLRIWGSAAGNDAEPGGGPSVAAEPPGTRLAVRQLAALIQKRTRYGLRDRRGLLCQLFLPSGTLLMLLCILSRHLFHSQPALDLDVGRYNDGCLGSPQNTVDFTHLSSINADDAQRVLEEGKPFWHGDLRRFQPPFEDEDSAHSDKILTSTLPGLFSNVVMPAIREVLAEGKAGGGESFLPMLKLQQMLADRGIHITTGRRLATAEAGDGDGSQEAAMAAEEILQVYISELVMEWWATISKSWHGAQSVAVEVLPWLPGMSLGAALKEGQRDVYRRRLQGMQADVDQRFESQVGEAENRQPSFAPGFGQQLGRKPAGVGGRQPLREDGFARWKSDSAEDAAEDHPWPWRPRSSEGWAEDGGSAMACMDASAPERLLWNQADADHDGKLSRGELNGLFQKLFQKVGARLGGSAVDGQELQDKVSDILVQAVFLGFHGSFGGDITEEEFCSIGASVRHEVNHLYDLAHVFSEQILENPSQCSRYGAYYVIQPPRKDSSPSWTSSAEAVVFVNTSSMHAAPAFQAALTNARFARLGMNKQVSVRIHPFPQTKDEQRNLETFASFFLGVYITLCLSFIPAGIAHSVVKERVSGARQLQVLSGASHIAYWLANLVFDLAMYTVPALCIPLALRLFGFRMLIVGDCGAALYSVLVAFGPAISGFSYLTSFFFKDHSKASNTILSCCLIGGMVFSTIIFILTILNYNPAAENPSGCDIPTEEFPEGSCAFPRAQMVKRLISPIFRLVPTVCVCHALFCIALVANLKKIVPQGSLEAMAAFTGSAGPRLSLSPFAWDWAGEPLAYLIVEGIVFCSVAVLLDTCIHSPLFAKLVDPAALFQRFARWRGARDGARSVAHGEALIDGGAAVVENIGDESVESERAHTEVAQPSEVALRVWRLEKTYRHWLEWRTPPKKAVRGVSLALHSGEVFGLLGHNGAGKTSALKCLIGELCCTSGTVHVGGFDMESNTGKARERIGYCPQSDALLELLTVRDHMELFGALKGIPAEVISQAPQQFKLEKMLERRADHLSGGNKRKLSAAISLIGSPALSVLDEPSCGLDPAARRALWATIHSAVAGATALPGMDRATVKPSCVLLTTHSMEEAEALSSRLGILAEGLLLTVGTSQQIKQRRGKSHELCFTLMPETESTLASAVQQLGGSSTLQPETQLSYQSVGPLLEAAPTKKRAYEGARCIVRAQMESTGWVEASVLAEWWVQQSRGEVIQEFLRGLVGEGVELAENFGLYWRFCLPHSSAGLPDLFGQLETRGKELGIAEYTLTQATLEQIFNSIAQGVDDQRALSA